MKGTKTRRGDGVWRLRVFVGYTENGTPRQISQTFRGSEKAADTALAALVTKTTLGTAPISATTTVRQYLEDVCLPHIEATRESSTVRGYRSKVARIVGVLGRYRLARLSTADIDRAYGRWLGEGLSPSSVHHLHFARRGSRLPRPSQPSSLFDGAAICGP